MAGIVSNVSNDQWSIREKLCLASSVIRSGDQNWVSVSRAIKPFSEPGRSPDWFSQKNCACQYSALLETVETPKRKRSERGEVVDTPGDLIVRKMTKERITELKAQLEQDKIRYRQLQREIEEIRSGQVDDRLQSMWDEIQEQKQAAKEAEEAQRLAAETAKAAAAAKPANKQGFQSPSKRRPQTKNQRPGSRTQFDTSSSSSLLADNVEVDDTALSSSTKIAEEAELENEGPTAKQQENSASAILTSLVTAELQKEQDAVIDQEEEDLGDVEADEAAEKLLAATASDLVELLSPYPEDSPSSQSVDECQTPETTTPTPTQAPRVKEPLILKIQKGVVKNREPQVETKEPQSEDDTQETEMLTVDEPVSDHQPTNPQANAGNPDIGIDKQVKSLKSPPAAGQGADNDKEAPRSLISDQGPEANNTDKATSPLPSGPATPKPKFRSPIRKSLSPEVQREITQKLDEALYQTPEGATPTPSPVRWLRSIQDRRRGKLSNDQTSATTQQIKVPEKKDISKKSIPNLGNLTKAAADRDRQFPEAQDDTKSPSKTPTITEKCQDLTLDQTQKKSQDKMTDKPKPLITSTRKRSPRKLSSPAEENKVTPGTKSRADPGDEEYHHIEPPSPEDTSSRDEAEIKVKKKGTRGRPPGSQRKSSRFRTTAPAEEEEDHHPETPSGRRSAGKDGTASSVASFIGDDSKDDAHSDAGDSDMTDKPSESDRDDMSASAGGLQSSFFLDSLPNSPASVSHSEEDHAYKIWRKAIMLVWRAIASHKYANVFLHPVTDDIAPGYKSIVMRPMDLITIKKNIENGVIRTTDQFHRDMMLMFQNAIMYNNADQHVHQIATIMQVDVVKQIEEFVSTQLLVQQPDSTKMLRGRGKQGQVEEDRSRRSSTDTDTSGKKRRTRADEY